MPGGDQYEAGQRNRVHVRGEGRKGRVVVRTNEIDLDPVNAPEHKPLTGERDLVPDPAGG